MGIFNRKNSAESKQQLSHFLDDDDLQPLGNPINYDGALSYLVGLSDSDYQTVCKVAEIYRKANKEAGQALGKPVEATTYIEPPLSEDMQDDLKIQEIVEEGQADAEAAFIQTDPKPKKIKVEDK